MSSKKFVRVGVISLHLTITLDGPREVSLPVHYNHLVQAAIYRQIAQPALRDFLHEQGFALGRRRFKLFAFSRLMGRVRRLERDSGRIFFDPPLELVISSPVPFVLEEIGSGFLREGSVHLGENVLEVRTVRVREYPVRSHFIAVRMLSPLVVYSTLEMEEGKRYTYYYSPFEPRFKELVLANLKKKHLLIFGQEGEERGFDIVPLQVRPRDLKIVNYKGTIIKGWMGTYSLTGDPKLLSVALDAGLGAKNSQGFGCCVLEEGGGHGHPDENCRGKDPGGHAKGGI